MVVIAGITNGDCTDCDQLNHTYHLRQNIEDPCVWSNSSACLDLPCEIPSISLAITCDGYEGTNYKITVTLGDHTWDKEYGDTPPDCCRLANESLPYVSGAADCDSSAATCTITAASGVCTSHCCDAAPGAPDSVLAVISGLVDNTCKHCECLTETAHYLERVADCVWETGTVACGWCYVYLEKLRLVLTAITDGARTGVRADFYYGGGAPFVAGVTWSTEFWDDTNPFSWDAAQTIAYSSDTGICDGSASSVTISPAQGAGTSYDASTDRNMACDDCATGEPTELRVDISGVQNGLLGCTGCTGLNATYVVTETLIGCMQEWKYVFSDNVPGCVYPCGSVAIVGVRLSRISATVARLQVWLPAGVAAGGYFAEWKINLTMPVDCGALDVTLTDSNRTQTYLGVCGGGGGALGFCDFSTAIIRVRAL